MTGNLQEEEWDILYYHMADEVSCKPGSPQIKSAFSHELIRQHKASRFLPVYCISPLCPSSEDLAAVHKALLISFAFTTSLWNQLC